MRMMMVLGGILAAGPALAHPHVWVDTKIEVILDPMNRATGVRIHWTYDDLYSLYIVGDMALDPDWDGQLTPEEEARLSGFDMAWDAGFAGDTYALMADADLSLSPPQDWTASYAEGRITSTHLRLFDSPVPVDDVPLIIQAYDPGYYVAYTISFDTVIAGGGDCRAVTYAPDLNTADLAFQEAMAEFTPDVDLEMQFPAVGKAYSEEVRVTCAAP
jgi:ABC-type uncharacterized transport system substrate-binding protein